MERHQQHSAIRRRPSALDKNTPHSASGEPSRFVIGQFHERAMGLGANQQNRDPH